MRGFLKKKCQGLVELPGIGCFGNGMSNGIKNLNLFFLRVGIYNHHSHYKNYTQTKSLRWLDGKSPPCSIEEIHPLIKFMVDFSSNRIVMSPGLPGVGKNTSGSTPWTSVLVVQDPTWERLNLAKNMLMFCFGSGKTSKIDGTFGHFPFLSCRVDATEMFVHAFFWVFPIVTEKSELHGSDYL